MIQDFHFMRPWWLLTLLPLVVLVPFWFKQLRQPQQLSAFIAPHLVAALGTSTTEKSSRVIWLASLCWLIASLAAAGPSWIKVESPTVNLDRGRVILIDASLATRSNDVRPDRFEQLKFKAHDLLNLIHEGATGLVAYSGDAFVVAPLTNDPQNILHMLPALSPEIMPEPGSNPLLGFQQAHKLLNQAGYQQADIFWLTGSIDREQMEDILRFFRQQDYGYRVSIIASGTSEGAPVRTQQGELLRDRQGRLIIPKLYSEHFERISQFTKGKYFRATTDDTDVQALVSLAPQSATALEQVSQTGYDQWFDFGPYLALLLLPLLVLLGYTNGKHSGSFFIAPIAMLLAGMWFYPSPVLAQQQATETLTQQIFQNREQRSLNLYKQQQFGSAAQQTNNHMLRGMSYYRQGDFAKAAEQFEFVNTPEGHYNRGNSLAKNGQLEDAVSAYTSALEQRPKWPEAEQNLTIAKQLLDQQKEQEQQDNSDSDSADSSDNKEQPEQQGQDDVQEQREPHQELSASELEPSASAQEPSSADQNPATEEQPAELEQPEPDNSSATDPSETMPEAWENLTEEEQEELTRLLRQLNDDPANLLRTRLLREAERRRMRRFN